jgi:predicted nucleic acid-binding protein
LIEGGAGEETPILVVDTGVAAKWYLNEDLEEEAARLLDAGERGEVRLVAPDPIAAEFFNVLWQHHMGHRGAFALPRRGEELLARVLGRADGAVPCRPLTRRAAEITLEVGVISYDALFLALAEVGEAVLVTADERTILRRIEGTPYESLATHLANVDALPAHESVQKLGHEAVLYTFDQIALSFNSFRGYRVSRHSIPLPASVVAADLSMA